MLVLVTVVTTWIAWPSLRKFLAGGVMVEVSRLSQPTLRPPAVTFCARLNDASTNWDEAARPLVHSGMVSTYCGNRTADQALACARNRTLDRASTALGAARHLELQTPLLDPQYWSANMWGFIGMCHTFQYTEKLGASMIGEGEKLETAQITVRGCNAVLPGPRPGLPGDPA